MTRKALLIAASAVIAITLLLYEVRLAFEFALPAETAVADPAQEARYAECYAAKDDEIHRTAFGTIDNPDVQKEFITSNRARAARECRNEYPEQTITTSMPLRFNLVDLEPRYW